MRYREYMKCPKCGYSPKRGRPKKLDDEEVRRLMDQGLGIRGTARKLGVTHGAVAAALKRQMKRQYKAFIKEKGIKPGDWVK